MPSNAITPRIQAIDGNGDPYAGAKLYFFDAGTTTPLVTYQDSALTTPHAHPVVADAAGRFPLIYLPNTTFKIRLTDAADVTVFEEDNLNTATSLTASGGLVIGNSDLEGAEAGFITASTGDSGVTSPSTDADDLLVEGDSSAGITIATPNNVQGNIAFADPENSTACLVQFDHSTDTWKIAIQSQDIITATTTLITLKKNAQADGSFTVTGVVTAAGGLITDSIVGLTAATDLSIDAPTGQDVVFKTNAVETARVTSDGDMIAARYSNPAQNPYFTAQWTGVGGTDEVIADNSTNISITALNVIDPGGHFDRLTGEYTAPVSGLYAFSWKWRIGGVGIIDRDLRLQVDTGSGFATAHTLQLERGNDYTDSISTTYPISLSVGDKVRLQISGGSMQSELDATLFAGWLI